MAIIEICNYLQNHEIDMFNGQIKKNYSIDTFNILRDEDKGLLYSYWMGKKIYLKSEIKSEAVAKEYLCLLCKEQDENSPHCYHIDKLNLNNQDIVIDAGAAEGFFALQTVDLAKKIYLVESDEEWLEALKYTFEPYSEKVVIIPKRLGNRNDENTISIDFINRNDKITLVKLDVEGAEMDAIAGGEETFSNPNIQVIACTYHRTEDADEIYTYFHNRGFDTEFSKGYLFVGGLEIVKPELRKGVLTARRGIKFMEKVERNYTLSVCIPNYNRIKQLESLVRNLVGQIVDSHLEDTVELCVSDDCSATDPKGILEEIRKDFPMVSITYKRNRQNMGMDHNFLQSVLISCGRYTWIIGNDDVPEENALLKIISIISKNDCTDIDIIVTPFDAYDYSDQLVRTVYPLGTQIKSDMLFDTSYKEQLQEFIMTVNDNSAIFGFLSNVVFKRRRWIEHGDMFKDKMSSIFIQVYMNLQTLMEGARYLYTPQKIIRNMIDDETNETIERAYCTTAGFYDAMDFFFKGEDRVRIEKSAVDYLIGSIFMELPENDERKKKVDSFVSEKMDMLKKYYVKRAQREQYFANKAVIVYGAGKFGHIAVDELIRYKAQIIGICDADASKQGGQIQGKLIFDFDTLLSEYTKYEGCIVVVANNAHLVSIIKKLTDNSVSRIAIIT